MGVIFRPTAATSLTPLENVFGAVADSIEAMPLVGSVADLAAVAAYTTANPPTSGDLLQIQEGFYYLQYNGSIWVQLTTARFATTSARDTAFAKASAAYRIANATAYTADVGFVWQYYTLYNVSTNPFGAITAGWYPGPGQNILCKLATTNVTALAAADTAIPWTSMEQPWPGMWVVGNPTRMVLPYLGMWECEAWVTTSSGDTKLLRSAIALNGATASASVEGQQNMNGAASVIDPFVNPRRFVVTTTATDYIEVKISTNSVGASTVPASTKLLARYVGPSRS